MSTGQDFSSDNASPVAPEVLAALAAANAGTAASYGDDPWTVRLKEAIAVFFERPCAVFPVFTGTAANALALSHLAPSYGAIFAHESAHLAVDECGAPEFFTGGAKVVPIAGPRGKVTPEALEAALAKYPRGVMHHHQPAVLSVTQGTECGTVYQSVELRALCATAAVRGLKVHMDGARFANALVATGASPADLTWRAGVEALSLGFTKNGALSGEAVVVFEPALADGLIYRQKRAGHVASKMRFASAQLLAMLDGGLWRRLAANANARASELAAGAADLGLAPHWPAEINEVFLPLERASADRLRALGFRFHPWWPEPEAGPGLYRFVTSFASKPQDVEALLAALARVRA